LNPIFKEEEIVRSSSPKTFVSYINLLSNKFYRNPDVRVSQSGQDRA
jgi:hypothetical protein